MSLSIEISPELEPLLKSEAGKAGLDPATYTENLLRKSLVSAAPVAPAVSANETRLLREINEGLSPDEITRYQALIRKRQEQTISPEEFRELQNSTRRLETIQVRRLERLAELAELRRTDLGSLIVQLGIQPADIL